MKKTYFIVIFLFVTGLTGYGQTAFYDAQYFASITPQQKAEFSLNYPAGTMSADEVLTINAVKAFLNNPFDATVKRSLLNPKAVKKILDKLISLDPNNPSSDIQSALHNAAAFGSSSNTVPILSGVSSDISRLSSADFQSMLIDATAKYLAESFKEDMTYRYFRLLKDKINATPLITDLFPKSCAVIEKIDPFNFKNLGDSWKAAFEQDLQNLPVNMETCIKNNQNGYKWCKNVYVSPYYRYFCYSADILQPLIKGEHPVEILQTLDQNYSASLNSDPDGYKGFIHFLNILQTNLQDTLKKSDAQNNSSTVWISFNQLKELNTPTKLADFCGLIYLEDPAFFDAGGVEFKKLLVPGADVDNARALVVAHLSNFLVLLNQVEGSFQQIKALKSSNGSTAAVAGEYMKEVLSIADSTNSFLKSLSSVNRTITNVTNHIDNCLTYGNDAYDIYTAVVQKNYAGAIQQTVAFLQTVNTKGNANLLVVQNLLKNVNAYSTLYQQLYTEMGTLNADLGAGKSLSQDNFDQIVYQNLIFNTLNEDAVQLAIENKIGYSDPKTTATIIKAADDYFALLKKDVATLNSALLINKDIKENEGYTKILAWLGQYGNVIAGVATAQNSDELETVIKNYIASSGTYVIQRTSLSTISIAAKVGLMGGMEGTDHFGDFKPNFGLSVPIGFEFTWGGRTTTKTDYPYLTSDNKIKYLNEKSNSLFIQVFDIAAVVNYRLGADSSSTLPQKILLQQVFSPGLTYNIGLKNAPFDIGIGGEFTPELRKIGDQLQASTIRLFIRISWDKPLIFLHTNRQTSNGYEIGKAN